MRQLKEKG